MTLRTAMIFAAGRGERMRPLTDTTPKPLLKVGGKRLIEWHLEKLAELGVDNVIINTSHLAEQFPAKLGDGTRWNLRIRYSHEGPQALETGGGMLYALPQLGDQPFIVVNGDVWSDYDFNCLPTTPTGHAHLVLVKNPEQHPLGDFHLDSRGRIGEQGSPRLTYSGIGVYRASLFANWKNDLADAGEALESPVPARFALIHLLRAAMRRGEISGEHHKGDWTDAGTPRRLAELDAQLRTRLAVRAPDS